MDNAIVVSARHMDPPGIAAHLAVLNETAIDVRLDVDFHSLAAERTSDHELVCHLRQSYCNAGQLLRHRMSVEPEVCARAFMHTTAGRCVPPEASAF